MENYNIKILGEGTRQEIAETLLKIAADLKNDSFDEGYFNDGEYYDECLTITHFEQTD